VIHLQKHTTDIHSNSQFLHGNTYVVINDDQGDAIDADFENGADAIIQITGTVDLSTASYNETAGTLVVA
jgi:hypothetical protein